MINDKLLLRQKLSNISFILSAYKGRPIVSYSAISQIQGYVFEISPVHAMWRDRLLRPIFQHQVYIPTPSNCLNFDINSVFVAV